MSIPTVASDDVHRQFIEANAPTPVVSESHSDINVGRLLTLFEGLGLNPDKLISILEGDACKPEILRAKLSELYNVKLKTDSHYKGLVHSIQLLIHLLDQPENLDMYRNITLPIAFACFWNVTRLNYEINQAILILKWNNLALTDLPPSPPGADLV